VSILERKRGARREERRTMSQKKNGLNDACCPLKVTFLPWISKKRPAPLQPLL
jgi:hypothetical protein